MTRAKTYKLWGGPSSHVIPDGKLSTFTIEHLLEPLVFDGDKVLSLSWAIYTFTTYTIVKEKIPIS